ncbi:MAG: hypothetical protein IPK99_11020 [Flavobacteriales bacterium]|nr:hypothetical protein [Flavobacteriales bacterium]
MAHRYSPLVHGLMTSTRTIRLFAAVLIGLFLQSVSAQVSQTFITSSTFNTPAGVNKVVVECWGGGGRGASRTTNGQGGGGGGGAYSRSVVNVTPLTSYTVTVGTGSTSGAVAGGDSWFNTAGTVMAKGGGSVTDNNATGAVGGTSAASIGTVKFNGGNGANGASSFGGGGGSSAGYGAIGGNGPGAGIGGIAPAGGGAGGGGPFLSGNGTAGTAPGGGGGGAVKNFLSGAGTGGNGANGKVIVSYYNNGSCMATASGFNNITDNGCVGGQITSIPIEITGQPTTGHRTW